MTPTFETARLVLRPLDLADAAQVQSLFPQWEIVRYLTSRVPWPYPPDGAQTFYRDVALPAISRGEAWHWTIRLQADPEKLIGNIVLSIAKNKNRGFWIAPPWQGQGLMTEACDAVTDYWFNVLKYPVMRVPKAIANEASRRISIKQGMRVIAREEHNFVSGRLPTEIWEITAEEWNLRRSQRS